MRVCRRTCCAWRLLQRRQLLPAAVRRQRHPACTAAGAAWQRLAAARRLPPAQRRVAAARERVLRHAWRQHAWQPLGRGEGRRHERGHPQAAGMSKQRPKACRRQGAAERSTDCMIATAVLPAAGTAAGRTRTGLPPPLTSVVRGNKQAAALLLVLARKRMGVRHQLHVCRLGPGGDAHQLHASGLLQLLQSRVATCGGGACEVSTHAHVCAEAAGSALLVLSAAHAGMPSAAHPALCTCCYLRTGAC